MIESSSKTRRSSRARLRVGVVFIVLSYLLGWPFLLGMGSAAAFWESAALALTGPVVYALSWGLLGVGVWLAGPEATRYVKGLFRRIWNRRGMSDEG